MHCRREFHRSGDWASSAYVLRVGGACTASLSFEHERHRKDCSSHPFQPLHQRNERSAPLEGEPYGRNLPPPDECTSGCSPTPPCICPGQCFCFQNQIIYFEDTFVSKITYFWVITQLSFGVNAVCFRWSNADAAAVPLLRAFVQASFFLHNLIKYVWDTFILKIVFWLLKMDNSQGERNLPPLVERTSSCSSNPPRLCPVQWFCFQN